MICTKIKNHLLLLLIIVSSSCSYFIVPGHIKKGFTFKFDGNKTNIDSLINIDGYYVVSSTFNRPVYSGKFKTKTSFELDTLFENFLFYRDGIYVKNIHDWIGNKDDLNSYFKEVIHDKTGKIKRTYYNCTNWGGYRIFNDTIKVQVIYKPRFGDADPSWHDDELWFKVIDRNNIIQIETIPIHKMNSSDKRKWEIDQKEIKYHSATFVKTDTLPDSDCWLKKRKWFREK